MNLPKLAALGLVVALAGACDNNTDKPEAEGTNNATTSTNAATTAAPKEEEAKLLEQKPPFEATGPVAKVNGVEITAAAYNEEVQRFSKGMGAQLPPQIMIGMKDRIVDNLVMKHLVEAEIAAQKITVPDAEVDKEFAEVSAQLEKAAPGGLDMALAQMGSTKEDLKKDIRKALELKALLAKDHDLSVPDAELKKFYDENKDKQFSQPERVHARHILIKVEEGASEEAVKAAELKINEIAQKAKATGADFAQLAQQLSEGPTAPRGGDLGFFQRGQMVPEFDKVAWEMKPGTVSDPVRTKFGFHVIKVEERKGAETMSYKDAKRLIEAQLQQPKMQEAMRTKIEALKAKATIEKLDQNIKTNIQAPPPGSAPMGMGMGGHPPMSMPPQPPPQPGQGAPPAPPSGEAPKLKLDSLK